MANFSRDKPAPANDRLDLNSNLVGLDILPLDN
jgi:hypothetical protein